MDDSRDSELLLTTGRLLGLFFALAAICALTFALGFSLGRSTAPQPSPPVEAVAQPRVVPGRPQPSAVRAASAAACPAGTDCSPSASGSSNELTFYKSVENQQPDAQLAPVEEKPGAHAQPAVAPNAAAPHPAEAQSPRTLASAAAPAATPPTTNAPAPEFTAAGEGGFLVQVAAVSKREDADALVGALRNKQYPVFVVANVPGDRLFHVQVGPFSQLKDAEAVKARLSADGYNAIVKR